MTDSRSLIIKRSGNRCEAMVRMPLNQQRVVWARCYRSPVEVHHMLTRARGGRILDAKGETAHLLALCAKHHREAHSDGGDIVGLMMNGYITTAQDGSIVYEGTDPRLRHLQRMDVSDVQQGVPRDRSGERLRRQT
jgi:hypothetical protein